MLLLKIIVSNVLYCCTVNLSRHNYFLANKNLLFYQCLFVYIIKRTLHGGLRIWILFSRGKNNILLTRGALSYNIVLPLENKIHIFAPPCNILYIYALNGESYWTAGACLAVQHFIHTNRPYNFANIPSPSSTNEVLVFFKNSAELSSPVSFTQQPLLWQFGSSSAHVKYGVFISASIFFFAKRSMVSESDAYYTQKSSFFWWRWFLTTHVLYVSGFTHQLFQLLLRCAF